MQRLVTVFGAKTSGLARIPGGEKMKAEAIMGELREDHFACSICGNSSFEIEQVSEENVRLTCENCGQCHLIVVGSKVNNQITLEFCNENKNKWDITCYES